MCVPGVKQQHWGIEDYTIAQVDLREPVKHLDGSEQCFEITLVEKLCNTIIWLGGFEGCPPPPLFSPPFKPLSFL